MRIDERLGQEVARQRRLQGLSLRELASRSGLGLSHIYKIEKGRYNSVRAQTLRSLEAGLALRSGYFKGFAAREPKLIEEGSIQDVVDRHIAELVKDLPLEVPIYRNSQGFLTRHGTTYAPSHYRSRTAQVVGLVYEGPEAKGIAASGDILIYDESREAQEGEYAVLEGLLGNVALGVVREGVIAPGNLTELETRLPSKMRPLVMVVREFPLADVRTEEESTEEGIDRWED